MEIILDFYCRASHMHLYYPKVL